MTDRSNRDNDIAYDIMTPENIKRRREEVEEFRGRKQVTSREMESLASRCGRQRSKRGREPTYINPDLPQRRPISIPHHGKGNLTPGVKNNILRDLEGDLDAYEERNTAEAVGKNGHQTR